MKNIKNYTLEELKNNIKEKGYSQFLATQIFDWIYRKDVLDFKKMSNISKQARVLFSEYFYFSKIILIKSQRSDDSTEKFLFKLEDNHLIETVLIPEKIRNTLCISTQVGCKFGCKFCLSGVDGFKRNLEPAEIINQFLEVKKFIVPKKITNVVFMGIGEPLDNFDNLIKSIKILQEKLGINFGRQRICISTSGIVPKMEELLKLNLGIKLSISLHSGFEDKRSSIMPVNKKFPLKDLIRLAKKFSKKRIPITFEYVLIKDFNDSADDVKNLVQILKGMKYKLNIIPYNNSDQFQWSAPNKNDIDNFKNELVKNKLKFTIRKSRGQDIKAACGQLKAEFG